jgi:predicted DNA-binding transcriptional regulator AlpA
MIDAKATCEAIHIGKRKLWELTNCNAIPCRRIGRSVRYVPAELQAWIDCGCPTEPGSAERVRKAVRP